eukprot:scaffold12769_cov141-Cylindrotheca_fusiformis.AAC.6
MTVLSRCNSICIGTGFVTCLLLSSIKANPMSKPYSTPSAVPFRTDPFDQDSLDHRLEWTEDTTKSKIRDYDPPSTTTHNELCPLQFSLGISSRSHKTNNAKGLGIVEPPVIFPVLPGDGPGRQVLYNTQYEHLDMLTPARGQQFQSEDLKEGLIQHIEFPLLFESSSFLTSPIIGDVNQDGIPDAILADYDGGIYAIGLQVQQDGKRWFHRTQVPRIYIRRKWMESFVNETLGIEANVSVDEAEPKEGDEPNDRSRPHVEKPHDPYHTHFEYLYGTPAHHEEILRGVPANIMGQEKEQVATLEKRRKRQVQHHPDSVDEDHRRLQEEEEENPNETEELYRETTVDITHRRLQEVVEDPADVVDQNNVGVEVDQDVAIDQNNVEVEVDQNNQNNMEHEVDQNVAVDQNNVEVEVDQDVAIDQNNVEVQVDQNNVDAEKEQSSEGKEEEHNQDHINDKGVIFGDDQLNYIDDIPEEEFKVVDDEIRRPLVDDIPPYDDYYEGRHYGDDNTRKTYEGDDEYGRYDDYYGRYYHSEHDEYYDDKRT